MELSARRRRIQALEAEHALAASARLYGSPAEHRKLPVIEAELAEAHTSPDTITCCGAGCTTSCDLSLTGEPIVAVGISGYHYMHGPVSQAQRFPRGAPQEIIFCRQCFEALMEEWPDKPVLPPVDAEPK